MVTVKTTLKSYGVMIIAFCSMFLETLFLSYKLDLKSLDTSNFTKLQLDVYDAQLSMCNMMNMISLLILGLFSFVLLFFSVERYIEENKSNMGVLKALGYNDHKLSLSLMTYSIPVFVGTCAGYLGALAFSKLFYNAMNADHIYPDVNFSFNITLCICVLFGLPVLTLCFSYLIGRIKFKVNALDMINQAKRNKRVRITKDKRSFLIDTKYTMLKNNIALIIFVGFATLCFSATVQMAFTMYFEVDMSMLFFLMMLFIGLILGVTIMILAFKFVFLSNKNHISILKAFGYDEKQCYFAFYGGYYIVSAISFILGTLYQVLILSIMFKAFEGAYEIKYEFSFLSLAYSFVSFAITYGIINLYYYFKINKLTLDNLNVDLR